MFGLAGSTCGHPPYENNKEEGETCRVIGGFGCQVGRTFYDELAGAAAGYVGTACGCAAVGGADDAVVAASSYRCMGGFAGSYALCLDIAARG